MWRKLYNITERSKNNCLNNKQRNVVDIKSTSSAHMISMAGIHPKEPLIICGKHNKAIPVVRQLVKMAKQPFLLIGAKRDLNENSCLRLLKVDWESETIERNLPEENGMLILKAGEQTNLLLKEYLAEWNSHMLILCLGNGLQIDCEMLNLLNSTGNYILLCENLQRSVKSNDGCKLTVEEVLASMSYIIVSSIGTAGKDLLKVLPCFESERVTNTWDISLHGDGADAYRGMQHRNGRGIRFGQSRTPETRCIFDQDDLIKMQDENTMLIYNTMQGHSWLARVIG